MRLGGRVLSRHPPEIPSFGMKWSAAAYAADLPLWEELATKRRAARFSISVAETGRVTAGIYVGAGTR